MGIEIMVIIDTDLKLTTSNFSNSYRMRSKTELIMRKYETQLNGNSRTENTIIEIKNSLDVLTID